MKYVVVLATASGYIVTGMYKVINVNIVKVNLKQLVKNIEIVREGLDKGVKLLFTVKGEGYGHGMLAVARLAKKTGVDYLGVSDIAEGEKLRIAGIKLPILIMGQSLKEHVKRLVELDVDIAVTDVRFAQALDQESQARDVKTSVHVNVDTGMGRSGVFPEQAVPIFRALRSLSHLRIKGVFSHLSTAYLQGAADRKYTLQQIEKFSQVLGTLDKSHMLPPLRHIASSDALVWYRNLVTQGYFNMVRIGELIYGHNTALNQGWSKELKPAMSVTTRIIEIREVPAGYYIGYGQTYRTNSPRRVAVLPIGYAHGLNLRLSNRGEVAVRGRRAPIIGEICMNQTVIDITEVDGAYVGDEVEVIGPQIPLTKLAHKADMDSLELLVSFSGIRHIYIDDT